MVQQIKSFSAINRDFAGSGGSKVIPRLLSIPYVGPGDIISGATGWWGLRAFSSATIGTNCVRIERASDNTHIDVVTLTDGSLDIGTITSFLSGTTGKFTILYDQSGGGNNFTQASFPSAPEYLASAIGTRPAIKWVKANTPSMGTVSSFTRAQPFSTSHVANCNSTGTQSAFISEGTNLSIGYSNGGGNNVWMYANGILPKATASDGSPHAIQTTWNNASSEFYVDGTATSVNLASSSGFSTFLTLGSLSLSQYFDGTLYEVGFWNAAFSSGVKTSLDTNQHAYWGF